MSKIKLIALLCFVTALTAHTVAAQTTQAKSYKNQYQNIEVARFDVKAGADVPAEYLDELAKDVTNQLRDTKKFKQVARTGESLADANAPTLRLTGTITEFKKGSRAKRYLIGFGAGKTKMVAHIKYLDAATGALLFERDVDGKVIIGLFGGDSKGTTNGVAKELAKVTKKEFF